MRGLWVERQLSLSILNSWTVATAIAGTKKPPIISSGISPTKGMNCPPFAIWKSSSIWLEATITEQQYAVWACSLARL
ncbi:hypothetical protein E2N90_27380 [Pseudomonas syringae pv. tomato]|nr:hypothetical protein E2N90_27380 [Pseudomonas syringae pv. tomato]